MGVVERPADTRLALGAAVAAWAVLAVTLFAWVAHEKLSEGNRGPSPPHWPSDSALVRAGGKRTVVMFLHPECPCSRASLDELNLVMNDARAAENTETLIVFYNLGTPAAPNVESGTWTQARRVPTATRVIDLDRTEAARFGARTSGFVVAYDVDSTLLYSGGLTDSRGHQGDNVGRRSLLALLQHTPALATERPVYGCALEEPATVGRP